MSKQQPRQAIVVQIPASQLPQQQTLARGRICGRNSSAMVMRRRFAPQVCSHRHRRQPAVIPGQRGRSRRAMAVNSPRPGARQTNRPTVVYAAAGASSRSIGRLRSRKRQRRRRRRPASPRRSRSYYPVAPYDSLSGSSFGTPAYPYGGGVSRAIRCGRLWGARWCLRAGWRTRLLAGPGTTGNSGNDN